MSVTLSFMTPALHKLGSVERIMGVVMFVCTLYLFSKCYVYIGLRLQAAAHCSAWLWHRFEVDSVHSYHPGMSTPHLQMLTAYSWS